jgi:hypothetical protein
LTKTLSGVIAAIATPIDEDGAPDLERAVKLARYLLDNGCDGLNVLGTTGEATSFSLAERKAVMDAYKTNGLPLDRLMVGTGAAAVSDAVALTRHAADLGFAGALVLPPDLPLSFSGDVGLAVARHINQAPAGIVSDPYRGLEGLFRRHGFRTIRRGAVRGLRGLPFDRSLFDRSTFGSFRGLHLGHRKPQRRSVRTRLEHGRYGRTGSSCHNPQTVRREALGLRGKGAARSYPRGHRSGTRATAVGTFLGSGSCRCGLRARRSQSQTCRVKGLCRRWLTPAHGLTISLSLAGDFDRRRNFL